MPDVKARAKNVTGRGADSGLLALDPREPKDLAAIHEATRRWPARFRAMTAERREAIVAALMEGLAAARARVTSDDTELCTAAMKYIATANSVMTRMVEIEQRDDHAAAGVQQPGLAVTVYAVPPPVIPRISHNVH